MIETGEETGRLEQSFQALADYYDRQQQLMSQIRSALLYPFILMILMLVILVVLLVKVLPIFNQVYEQLGGTMGGTAKLLLRFGDWLGSIMPVLCGIIFVIVLVAAVIACSKRAKRLFVKLYKKFSADTELCAGWVKQDLRQRWRWG